MTKELKGSGAAQASSDQVWRYIEDMTAELADLAAANGDYRLAAALRVAALEAARREPI